MTSTETGDGSIRGLPHDPGAPPPTKLTATHIATNVLVVGAAAGLALYLLEMLLAPAVFLAGLGQSSLGVVVTTIGIGADGIRVVGIFGLMGLGVICTVLVVRPNQLREKYAQWHADNQAWIDFQHQQEVAALKRKQDLAEAKKHVVSADDDLAIAVHRPHVARTLELDQLQHAVAILTNEKTIQGLKEDLEDSLWERQHTRAWRELDARQLMRMITGIMQPPQFRTALPSPATTSDRRRPRDIGAEQAAASGDKAETFAVAMQHLRERRLEVLAGLARAGHGPGTPVYDQTEMAFKLSEQELREEYGIA